MQAILSNEFLGNPIQAWLIALGVAVLVHVLVRTTLAIVLRQLKRFAARTTTNVDDLVHELLDKTKFVFVALVALWVGSLYLTLPPAWDLGLRRILVIGVLIQVIYWSNGLINFGLLWYRRRQEEDDPGMVTALGAIGFLIRVAAFSLILLMGLANLGIEVGPLIASLGIGGFALALASQNIIGDLFASMSIVFDKPFLVGDYIQVGSYVGTVEHVGLKTSRIRSLTGEQLVFNNSDLLGSRIQNFKRREERRVAFKLGVTYGTPREKLEKIPSIVRNAVESQEHTRFDRCFLESFGDSAMIFDVVYHLPLPDFQVYADCHQAINFMILEAFEAEEIEFAFPTQTVHLEVAGGAPGVQPG